MTWPQLTRNQGDLKKSEGRGQKDDARHQTQETTPSVLFLILQFQRSQLHMVLEEAERRPAVRVSGLAFLRSARMIRRRDAAHGIHRPLIGSSLCPVEQPRHSPEDPHQASEQKPDRFVARRSREE